MDKKHLKYQPSNNLITISNHDFDLIVNNFILINNLADRGKFIYRNFECFLIDDELQLYASNKDNDFILETYKLNPNKQNLYKTETHFKIGTNEDHDVEFLTKNELIDFIEVMKDISSYRKFCFE